MKKPIRILLPAILLSFSLYSFGHHSWRAVYGDGEEVELVATVTSNPQRNPHWQVNVEIANHQGESEEWVLQWRNRRGSDRTDDPILALLRSGEEFQVLGQKSHLSGNNSILIQEIKRLSDGVTAVSNRDQR